MLLTLFIKFHLDNSSENFSIVENVCMKTSPKTKSKEGFRAEEINIS